MSKKRKRKSGANPRDRKMAPRAAAFDRRPPLSSSSASLGFIVLGVFLLANAAAASVVLVIHHFDAIELPGCGRESACAALADSVWGRVPGLNWPVSHVGAAYFLAALVGWMASAGALGPLLRGIVRLGAGLSLMYVIVMLVRGQWCPWCAWAHGANLAFWITVELGPRSARQRPAVALAPVAGFVVATLSLVAIEIGAQSSAEAAQEQGLAESVEEMITASAAPDAAEAGAEALSGALAARYAERGFTGRYVFGPDPAPIRIVMFTDYQCELCQRVELEIMALVRARDDVSLSVKHFPFSSTCNRHISTDRHPNACWAARAAEAAGQLRGDDGFFAMHEWLFARRGGVTDGELRAFLNERGYDVAQFEQQMRSPETLTAVQADIEEAIALGIVQTPMIFINGVEFRGIGARQGVTRAVVQLAATNPPARSAVADEPILAIEKYLELWRANPLRPLPPDPTPHTLRTSVTTVSAAATEIVVWGDYQEPQTTRVDALLRSYMRGHDDVALTYTFRHYPFNTACNPALPVETRHPLACLAALSAEAAGVVGGDEAYWSMHAFLFSNRDAIDRASVGAVAEALGLERAAFEAALDAASTREIIAADARGAKTLGLTAIPMVMVDGRHVPRFTRGSEIVLDEMLDAVVAGSR